MSNDTFSPERLLEAMNGMNNVELAERLGCSRSNITMYLNGSRKPTKMTIQLMALNLGVSPAWLMGLNVDKFVKKPAATDGDELSKDELDLLNAFHSAPESTQEAIRLLLKGK